MRSVWSIIVVALLVAVIPEVNAAGGTGQVRLGYTFLDEEGSQSANQATFNTYEGLGLSLEQFRYDFLNGMRLNAELKNITLNNRNLGLGLTKSGLFGLKLSNNQYRRPYNFDGSSRTRRHVTDGSVWVFPFSTVKLFAGGSLTGLSGSVTSLINPDGVGSRDEMEYDQNSFNAGGRFNYQGHMLQAEYRGLKFDDKKDASRNQDRYWVKLYGFAPLPYYEKVLLSGGFRHFETKYRTSDFRISSNTVWGGASYEMNERVDLSYNFIFDRASSDSDFVATDNLAHTFYVSYTQPNEFGGTAGYQTDVRDDFEDKLKADSYYLSGWYKPVRSFEFRAEHGSRAERIDEGSRFIGNEDRTRFKLSGIYRNTEYGSLAVRFENRQRENETIGSEADFKRIALDGNLRIEKLGSLAGGYAYSKGDYDDRGDSFEFADHTIYADVTFREYKKTQLGCGVVYYRSRRDLDVEHVSLRFNAAYLLAPTYNLKIEYNVHNFDDFLVDDAYYTANIVEVNLIKDLSF